MSITTGTLRIGSIQEKQIEKKILWISFELLVEPCLRPLVSTLNLHLS